MRDSVRDTGCSPPWASPRPGKRHIQRLGRQLAIQFGLLQRIAAGLEHRFHRLLGFVDTRAGGFAFVSGHRAQAFEEFGQLTAFAQIRCLDLLQRLQVGTGLNSSKGVSNDFVGIAHGRVSFRLFHFQIRIA